MSSLVSGFPNVMTTAQLPLFTTVVLKTPPLELLNLPSGSVLPAVITPLDPPTDGSVIQFMLPDGSEITVEAKIIPTIEQEMAVSIKTAFSETKETVGLKIFFATPEPNLEQTIEALAPQTPENIVTVESVEVLPQKTMTSQAFMLNSVPEQITALLPELVEGLPETQGIETKMLIEIMPEENALPALGQTEKPVLQSTVQNTPLPQPPVEEIVKVIELPKEEATLPKTLPVPEQTPSSIVSTTPEINTPLVGVEIEQVPLEQTQTSFVEKQPLQTETLVTPRPVQEEKETIETILQTTKNEIKTVDNSVKKELFDTFKSLLSFTPKKISQTVVSEAPLPVVQKEASENSGNKIQTNETVKGVVFAPEKDSPALVATNKGVFAVEEKIQLPHLTPVQIKVVSILETLSPSFAKEKEPLPVFKNTWEVLSHALETLEQTDELAFQEVRNLLPQTGQKLPALMLSFMNAATQGTSFSSFIGEANVLALKAMGEKGERLLKRLEKEFSTSSKKATEGRSSWKGVDIPILSGSIVEPVHLYLQAPSAQTEGKNKLNAMSRNMQRFVLDLNLSQLGKIQIEGLSQRQERLFNMILRHKEKLPEGFEERVSSIFTQTLSALNYAGVIKVDETDDFIVFRPEEDDDSFKQGVLV